MDWKDKGSRLNEEMMLGHQQVISLGHSIVDYTFKYVLFIIRNIQGMYCLSYVIYKVCIVYHT